MCSYLNRFNLLVVGVFTLCMLSSLSYASPALETKFDLNQGALLRRQTFQPHAGYLAMSMAFDEVKRVYLWANSNLNNSGVNLRSRGEAHITVIEPGEVALLASAGLSMSDLNQKALEMGIQDSDVRVECIGRGQVATTGDQTYFLVVSSSQLQKLRQEIIREFVERGGDASVISGTYAPHITVGFTKRDLFEADGVVKDQSSCISPLTLN